MKAVDGERWKSYFVNFSCVPPKLRSLKCQKWSVFRVKQQKISCHLDKLTEESSFKKIRKNQHIERQSFEKTAKSGKINQNPVT